MDRIGSVDLNKVLEIFNRIDFFNHFSFLDKKRIASCHSHLLVFNKGEYLISEGTNENHFFVILSGKACVMKGNDCIISGLVPGDFFGEMSFLTNAKRAASVVADEKMIVLKVDRKMLGSLSPEIREKFKDKIIEKLIFRLDQMNQKLVEKEKNTVH